ncbi:MAG: glycine--tRNA ligase subunit beta [Helicobacter sp.]|nr:glycine--tRNA ligase subunit beta [Helicobacter sp.]
MSLNNPQNHANFMPFFAEILVEEMPALALLNTYKSIESIFANELKEHEIDANFTLYYTPRRIVFISTNFPLFTRSSEITLYGPPIELAKMPNSPALNAFLQKNDLTIEDIKNSVQGDGAFKTVIKNNKEVICVTKTKEPKKTSELIGQIILNTSLAIKFGKSMRFSPSLDPFIRPVRNICAFLGNEFIEISAFGIKGKPEITLHRDINKIEIPKNLQSYLEILNSNYVILDQKKRLEKIRSDIKDIETQSGLYVELDNDILEENGALCEYPSAILGHFDEAFLRLPKEVISTSMKSNQRYFAVYKDKEKTSLANAFVLVTNSTNKDKSTILNGNQKVLKARLSDALFFYDNDLKAGFDESGLNNLAFFTSKNSSISMAQNVSAQIIIARYLCNKYQIEKQKIEEICESLRFSKCDLLSQMVGEFPELQGIIGSYYARSFGLNQNVAQNIKEQYLPSSEFSALPSNKSSAITALCGKIYALLYFFSINLIPSGSKDPFGLRRGATGLLKIILAFNFNFDIKDDLKNIAKELNLNVDIEALFEFITERFVHVLDINPSFLKALVNEQNALFIAHKAMALNELLTPEISSTFKRVANILKDKPKYALDPIFFKDPCENALYSKYLEISNSTFSDFKTHIRALCEFKEPLEAFFSEVRVLSDDVKLTQNRLALMSLIYEEFLKVADLKLIG